MIIIDELIEQTISDMLNEKNYSDIVESKQYIFAQHQKIWNQLKAHNESTTFYKALLKKLPSSNFTLVNLFSLLEHNSEEYSFVLLASQFVKMNDSRAPQTIDIEEFDNISSDIIASAGIYSMKRWIEDILKYKAANNSFKDITDNRFINLIKYLEFPSDNLSMLVESDREKACVFILGKQYSQTEFTTDILKYFDSFAISFRNIENKGYFYTSILYVIKVYWESILTKAVDKKKIQDVITSLKTRPRNVFYYKPDEKGYGLWDDCYNTKKMLFGFDNSMSIIWKTRAFDYESIRNSVQKAEKRDNKVASDIINRFINEIKKDDLILACEGNSKLIGIGYVSESRLFFDDRERIFKTFKKVEWLINLKRNGLRFKILNLSTQIIGQTVVRYNMMDTLKILNYLIGNDNELDIDYRNEKENEMAAENTIIKTSGQGFILDAKLRKQIEDYAMKHAFKYLTENGFLEIKDVSKNRPYDFKCIKNGCEYLIEVKGTQTMAKSVSLTYNEVRTALNKSFNVILYILHSIRVKQNGNEYILSEGQQRVFKPFELIEDNLKPITYNYTL